MRTIFASSLFLACLANSATAVPTVFTIDPAQSDLTLTLSVPTFNITDTDSTTLSGTIDADLNFGGTGMLTDPAGLTFTGGQVVLDQDMSLSLYSIFIIDATATIENAKGVFSTTNPPGSMTVQSTTGPVTTYEFDLGDHEFTLNEGTMTTTGSSIGGPLDDVTDFSVDPAGGAPDPGTIRTIVITDLGSDNYQAAMSLPFNVFQEVPLNDGNNNDICDGLEICGEIDMTVNLVATASFSLATFDPGDFDQDGDVDGFDFLLWQRGGSPTPLSASDLADWEASFGAPGPAVGAGVGAVPEPSSLVLLGLALGLIPLRTVRWRF